MIDVTKLLILGSKLFENLNNVMLNILNSIEFVCSNAKATLHFQSTLEIICGITFTFVNKHSSILLILNFGSLTSSGKYLMHFQEK